MCWICNEKYASSCMILPVISWTAFSFWLAQTRCCMNTVLDVMACVHHCECQHHVLNLTAVYVCRQKFQSFILSCFTLIIFMFNIVTFKILNSYNVKLFVSWRTGAVLRWGRGGTGPPNVGQPPPPNILFPTAKIRVLKSRLFLYSGEINTRVS